MKKAAFWVWVSLFLGCNVPINAQNANVHYAISFPNAVHHEAEVSLTLTNIPHKENLTLRMAESSAGRYAHHFFGKNIYNIKAYNAQHEPLEVKKTGASTWQVINPPQDKIIWKYTLFADHADGTYSGINHAHAHLNIPATFMWAEGFERQAIELEFLLSPEQQKEWKIGTQLSKKTDKLYYAPNWYYFMDSPIELANFKERAWKIGKKDEQTIRILVHDDASEQKIDAFEAACKKIVQEEIALFGEIPQYDHNEYTFICCFMPYAINDGMEHRNSTIITKTKSISQEMTSHLETVAHEFIHAWNVERLRPASIEPFDFTKPDISGELWFAEGFTTYLGFLMLRRANLIDDTYFAQILNFFMNSTMLSPALAFISPTTTSENAVLGDGASFADPTNIQNVYLSYYHYGAFLGFALDMELRNEFSKSLDDYMRLVWQKYGKTEQPYTSQQLEEALAELTQDKEFAKKYFQHHIYQSKLPDIQAICKKSGLLFSNSRAGTATLGNVKLEPTPKGFLITNYTPVGSPLYKAGLEKGDYITGIDGKAIFDFKEYVSIVANLKVGKKVEISFLRDGKPQSTHIEPIEAAFYTVTWQEQTTKIKDWLESHSQK